jgi:putative transposase
VGDSEDQAFWSAFLRSLRERGLTGVRLVISDHHLGLTKAIATVMIGAAWQRSSVHYPRRRLRAVEASVAGGMAPPVAPRRRERALAA